jgi:beta-lactam-binding protein with PASTA domain
VPDVVGRSQNDARAELERAGWTVTTRTVDNAAPRGTVVGQSPRGTALPGEAVVLSVSSGSIPPPTEPTPGLPPVEDVQPQPGDEPAAGGDEPAAGEDEPAAGADDPPAEAGDDG